MTHYELILKMNNLEPDDELDSVNSMNALRAVVELHKPSEAWGDTHCGFCFNLAWEPSGLEMMDKHFAYPCPTIKAIEKELG